MADKTPVAPHQNDEPAADTADLARTIADDVEATLSIKTTEHTLSDDSATSRLVVRPRRLELLDAPDSDRTDVDFELSTVLGEGGMGVVYAARQASLNRQIALKMMRADDSRDPKVASRFLSEAMITGELDHPNIVPVYELGKTADGKYFYAMKQVSGTSWSEVITEKSLRENLVILLSVCDAVAFAHDKGIMHRDLKPGNVMLGDYGEVLVMDWGLAMDIGPPKDERPIRGMSLAGTPAYMPPEMARCQHAKMGPASEVYLLGGILYEIATGLRPHPGHDARSAVIAAIQNEIQPTDIKGELIDIALKAVATEPEDRYPSVKDFQKAVRDYLAHADSLTLSGASDERLRSLSDGNAEDVYRACHEIVAGFRQAIELWSENPKAIVGLRSTRERFCREALANGDLMLAQSQLSAMDSEIQLYRLPGLAVERPVELRREVEQALTNAARKERLVKLSIWTAVTAGFLALAVTLAAYWVTRHQRDRAVMAEQEMAVQRNRAVSAERQTGAERDRARAAEEEESRQRARAETALRQTEKEAYLHIIALAERRLDDGQTGQAALLLDRAPAPLRGWEWSWLRGQCDQARHTLLGHTGPVSSVAFSPDGQHLVTEGLDRTVRVWKTADGTLLRTIKGHEASPIPLTFDADRGEVLWGIQNGRLQKVKLNAGVMTSTLLEDYYDSVYIAAFSPDGRHVVASSALGELRVWDSRTGKSEIALFGHSAVLSAVAVDSRDRRLLTGSRDGTARLWDFASGACLLVFSGHDVPVAAVGFSQDGTRAYTADRHATLRVWNAETGANLSTLPFMGADRPLDIVSFSPSGNRVLTAGTDAVATIWDLTTGHPTLELRGHDAPILAVAFSPDGVLAATGSRDRTARLWDAQRQPGLLRLSGHPGGATAVAFSPDARRLLTAGGDRTARIWDATSGAELVVCKGHGDRLTAASFSPDGTRVLTASYDGTARIWDSATGEQHLVLNNHAGPVTAAVYAPNGRYVATADRDAAYLWNPDDGSRVAVIGGPAGISRVLAFTPDASRLLIGEQSVSVWHMAGGTMQGVFTGHAAPVTALAVSADGITVADGDRDGTVYLWNMLSGKAIREFSPLESAVSAVAFTPDSRRLLTGSRQDVRVWNPQDGRELLSLKGHADWVTSIAVSPDGGAVATAGGDGLIRVHSARQR